MLIKLREDGLYDSQTRCIIVPFTGQTGKNREMMADTAVSPDILNEFYPFSSLKESANVLICPDLTSANISYELFACLGSGTDTFRDS